MRAFLGLIFGLTLIAGMAQADTLPDPCSRPDVFTLERALYPNQKDSKTFSYKYQYYKGGSPSDPVIVFMPGGPGEASIAMDPADAVPMGPGFNVIYTDQRGSGAGCNVFPQNTPDDVFTTVNFAEDIIAIIKKEKLQKYILYGHSYGTVHATLTASLIEQKRKNGEDIELPQALVLEGIVGHAFKVGEPLVAYQFEWNKLLADLPTPVQTQLRQEVPPFSDLPDVSLKWGDYLFAQLYNGRFPEEMTIVRAINLEWNLKLLASHNPSDVATLKDQIANSQTEDYGHTFRVLGCREIFADYPNQFALAKGVVSGLGNYCAGYSMDRPYDSKSWPTSIPEFYFEGTDDQATPLAQARYHFENQISGPKHFVLVEGASHMPLMYSLFAAGCKKKVWMSVSQGGNDLADVLKTCNWPWAITLEK